MSIATCDGGCGGYIDTDAHPESYVRVRRDNTIREECLCFNCMEEAELNDDLLPETPSPYLPGSGYGPAFSAWEETIMKRQYRLGLFRQPSAV